MELTKLGVAAAQGRALEGGARPPRGGLQHLPRGPRLQGRAREGRDGRRGARGAQAGARPDVLVLRPRPRACPARRASPRARASARSRSRRSPTRPSTTRSSRASGRPAATGSRPSRRWTAASRRVPNSQILLEIRGEIGWREKNAVGFLPRNHPVNVTLGKMLRKEAAGRARRHLRPPPEDLISARGPTPRARRAPATNADAGIVRIHADDDRPRDAPAHRREAPDGADAHDRARDRVRRRDGDAAERRADERHGARELGARAADRLELS